jgi:hypothetical protein
MIDNMTQPEQCAARFRMPVGTEALVSSPVAMILADAEVYTKGTIVFADGPAVALMGGAAFVRPLAVRPYAFGTWDVRTWSPPV